MAGIDRDVAGRDAVGREFAFDAHDEQIVFGMDVWRHIELERQVPAFVLAEPHAVEPHVGQVID
jgi:hypothetical protein